MTIIGIAIAILFLDWPWRGVLIVALALFEAFEIYLWLRWRKRRSVTGAEGIVGHRGTALSDCAPEGQVRVKGQIWRARSEQDVAAGEEVVVTDVDGIRLLVAPG
ncbi:MAG: hypothetical protein M3345_06230 [Actinomycetota bacterium]|nr:hypothetical protein [Actinomycetota bacterium]